jgi:AcrR family transcriptional regulator
VAERAGIAAGTVYRYFPSKTEMVAALLTVQAECDLAALRDGAAAAPGPLSALAAAIATLAARFMGERRLAWALLAEPVDQSIDHSRLSYRQALTAEIAFRLERAMAAGHVPSGDIAAIAPAILGALIEGLVGPLAPAEAGDAGKTRELVQTATLVALRAAGVTDARARGLVVQTNVPANDRPA